MNVSRAVAVLAAIGTMLTAATLEAQVRVEVEAAPGAPFGVGRVVMRSGGDFRLNVLPRDGLPRNGLPRNGGPPQRGGRIVGLAKRLAEQAGVGPSTNLKPAELAISERADRVYYPVFEKRDRPILREFIAVPAETSIMFLFTGDGPLELTVYTPEPQTLRVDPRATANLHPRLLRGWWQNFASAAGGRDVPKEFPPLVEEYLTDTLARRLNLPLGERAAAGESSILSSQLSLLAGTESARQNMTRAILTGELANHTASLPLPEELPRPKPEVLDPVKSDVESMAMHVPAECFYVRFGSFANFLWLRHRLDEWGGELRDVVAERGLDYGMNDRMQRQLGLRESGLAELLGDRVIADVALIGTDTFLREGAAIGMLFQAKSNPALGADLTQQRNAAIKAAKDGREEKLTIGGRSVSFCSTPDNTVRSFYVADGDFHLVTTSRAMVEWFLATGAGKHDSLGASDDFQRARARMPLARGDTVFVYLSPTFFQNLLSPGYQIELARRLRSAVEIEIFQMAQLAAAGEHKPGGTIDELIASGMLPAGFGERPDGSRLDWIDGKLGDSLRGARGAFLPVPDVPTAKITAAEAQRFASFASDYVTQWGPMDPVMAAVSRQDVSAGLEKVTIDVEAAPLSQKHIDMLATWLGPPTEQRLARVPGDIVSFEAVMRGGSFFSGPEHHLFGALRDADPAIATDPKRGFLARLLTSQLEGLQGYLGAWPNSGFLRLLGGDSNAPADPAGYSSLRIGLSRRKFDDFTVLSFQPEVLAQITPQLRFEQAPRPAQVWLHAEDLAQSKLAPLVNAYGYRQSRTITQGNTRFINMLIEQLHVPPAEAKKTAEQLLDARMVEPLGGEYELRDFAGGLKMWVSTALANSGDSNTPPADYQFPALNWLRGIDADLRADGGSLAMHAEVIMPVETKPAASGFKLPSLPGLPFGGSKPAEAVPKPQLPNTQPPKPQPSKLQAPGSAQKSLPPAPKPKAAGIREF
jgi:hypothetical protein